MAALDSASRRQVVPQEFDVVCLGGGVEAGPTSLASRSRRPVLRCGRTCVIHAFPAFNRVLGHSLNQLAAKVATRGEHHEQYTGQH